MRACVLALKSLFFARFFKTTFVVVALLSCAESSRAALAAYWAFDEGTGTVATDTSGNANNHNGALLAAPETPAWVPGRFGNALGFTWQAANNVGSGRRVLVPYHHELLLNGPFTISFWYKPDAAVPASTFPGIMRIASQGSTSGTNIGWGFFRTANMVHKRGNAQPGVYTSATMDPGKWYHIALRYDGAGNNIAYLNGVAVNFSQTWLANTATNIGFEMGRMDSFDQATLDDFALWWNEAASPARIRALYTVPAALNLNYSLGDQRFLWGVTDATGSSNAVVQGRTWVYAGTPAGSLADGDAYVGGRGAGSSGMFIVMGNGRGVSSAATFFTGTNSPGDAGFVGGIIPTNDFAITNALVLFDLNASTTPGAGVNDIIDVTGNLNIVNGSIGITPLVPLTGGSYRLVNYSGGKTGSFGLVNRTRYSVTLDESITNQVNVTVGGTNGSLKWVSASSSAWDLNTFNWTNLDSLVSEKFFQGDSVLFDDSAAFQTNIAVASGVFPRSMTVSSSTRPYIFTGLEAIGAMSEGLTKNGTSSLTLSTPNTFIGDVTVNAGVLRIGNASALGITNGQTIINSGATLDLAGNNIGMEPVTVQGAGVNGAGAIVNTGGALVNNGVRGRITLAGDTTFGGTQRWDPIGGSMVGNGYKLTKVGNNDIAMTDLGDTALGDIDIVQGTLVFQGNIGMGDPAKSLVVSNNAALAFWANGTRTFNKPIVMRPSSILRNQTSGGTDVSTNYGTVQLNGDVTVQASANIALMSEVSGSGNLIKTLAGALYIGGTNTYTGITTISQGRLAMLATGTINASPRINLASGAVLDTSRVTGGYPLAAGQVLAGSGTVAGGLIVPTNSTVLPGAESIPGTLTVTNGLALSGGVVSYEVSAATTEGSGINDLINVTGNLDLSGGITTIRINPLAILTNGATYTLINYSGTLSGSAANLAVDMNSRYTFTISDATPNKITITVTGGAAANLFWLGGVPGSESLWDVQTTQNWSDEFGANATFYGGDIVKFDNLGFPSTIDLVGVLTPAAISVENDDSVAYVFQGTGKLSGNSSLTKLFNGSLAIANSNVNDYIGSTTIQAGTLQVGAGGTFGNLGSGAITNNGTLIYSRSDTITFANPLVGSGSFIKQQTNTMVFSTSNSLFTGSITATGGIVRPTITNALGDTTGGVVVGPTATLDVNGLNLGAEPVTASGAGFNNVGAVINNGGGQNNALRFLTLAGDTTVGGSGRWDVRAAPTAALSTGSNSYSLTKIGAAQFSLVDAAVDPFLADINVQGGIFSAELSSAAGDPTRTVTVAPNATLQFFGRTVPWNKRHILNGGLNMLNLSGDTTVNGSVSISNTVMFDNRGNSLTIVDPITGPGSLVKTGVSLVTLVADNTYTGLTTIANGTNQFGNGGASGSVMSSGITNNGVLAVLRSDTAPFTNRITGTGSMHVRTPGGLDMSSPVVALGGTMSVGIASYGKLIVEPGVAMTVPNLFLGDSSGINGDAVQLGGSITVSAQMRVGHWPSAAGPNTYIMGGGTLALTGIPASPVVNSNSVGEFNGILYLGVDGTGVFIQTGGVASAHGIVLDNRANTVQGGDGIDRFILNGGRFNLSTNGIKVGAFDTNTSYAVELGGGTIGSSANWTSTLAMTLTGTNGSTVFDSGSFSNLLRGAINGAGGLIKTGPGTLALTGTNGYLGGTVITQGTVWVRGVLGGGVSSVTVQGGTLISDGLINDALNVTNGTLLPGPGIARLIVNNNVSLAGTIGVDINKTGVALTNDQVLASGAVSYGGTLTVTATGAALAPGDTFKLFHGASYAGAFSTLNLPTLSSNYLWDVSGLLVDGTIRVTQPVPRISFQFTGNSLQLSWSNSFSDFVLQAQTNPVTVGITTSNWVNVVTNTNAATFEVDTNNGTVFYRLIKP